MDDRKPNSWVSALLWPRPSALDTADDVEASTGCVWRGIWISPLAIILDLYLPSVSLPPAIFHLVVLFVGAPLDIKSKNTLFKFVTLSVQMRRAPSGIWERIGVRGAWLCLGRFTGGQLL